MLDGTTKKIKDIVENKCVDKIPCFDFENKKIVEGNIAEYHDTGVYDTIKITLANGYTICGTDDHPVIVKSRETKKARNPRWARLDAVTTLCQVGIPRQIGYFGTINNQYARLIGMMIGGGYAISSCQYSTEDNELIDYINDSGFEFHEILSKSFITRQGKQYKFGTIVGFISKMQDVGLQGKTKLNKILPIGHEQWNKESLQELIGGLFDTDGSIRIEDNRRCKIEYTSICLPMIKQIQIVLHKFGILSYIQKRNAKSKHVILGNEVQCKEYYVLHIRDKESVENFYNNIHLLVNHKRETLEKGIQLLQNHKNKIPKDLLDTDLRFVKVIKVEYTGKQHVYDLTVDKYHSFIANSVFVHNTNAKIVQIGTPKTKNHFYDAVEGKASDKWTVIKRDWQQCAQSWALGATYLPDPKTGEIRPYSSFILNQAMPKALKQEMFPNNPEVWTEGNLSIEDFRTQYMLEFIDGAGKFLTSDQVVTLTDGEFDWLDHGIFGETYVAGIDFAGSNPEGDATQITVLRMTRTGVKQKVFACEFKDCSYPQQMYEISRLFGGYNPKFEVKKICADYTGCGAPVIQALREEFGILNLEGIIFNSSDKFTHSGMNMKNLMYGKWKQELENGRFKYLTKERFLNSTALGAGKDNLSYYYRMVSEWADLEFTTGNTINKKIEAPKGYHDDVCDADVLANFAFVSMQRGSMPRPTSARIFSR